MKKAFLIAPSAKCSTEDIERAKKNLNEMGYSPIIRKDITQNYFYYAGSKERRIKEINDALKKKDIEEIFCVRGGMGAIHIIEKIKGGKKEKF